MLDLALLTANVAQLKHVLQSSPRHDFYGLMLGLISASILLQAIVAVALLIVAGTNIAHKRAQMLNNAIVVLVLIVTIINLVINGFGLTS